MLLPEGTEYKASIFHDSQSNMLVMWGFATIGRRALCFASLAASSRQYAGGRQQTAVNAYR